VVNLGRKDDMHKERKIKEGTRPYVRLQKRLKYARDFWGVKRGSTLGDKAKRGKSRRTKGDRN